MHVTLHLTTRCNMRCKYCYSKPGAQTDMTDAVAHQAVRFAASTYAPDCGIVLFGGEPLLQKDLISSVIRYAQSVQTETKTRFHYKITTNGTLLDDAFIDFAVREKLFIALSFDGVQSAHDAHRVLPDGSGTWCLIDQRAGRLLERLPYSPVMMTVCPETVGSYCDSVEYLLDKGFRYIICSLNYAGSWSDRTIRQLEKQYERLAKIYERRIRREEKFFLSPIDSKLQGHIHGPCRKDRCELGIRQVSVSPSGDIFPCVQFVKDGTDKTFAIGHVDTGIDSAAQQRLFKLSDSEKAACVSCAIKDRCNNSCGCLNLQTTGSLNTVSPVLCAHERMLIPIVDQLGKRLYKDRVPMFIQKHYNAAYPVLSLIDDQQV